MRRAVYKAGASLRIRYDDRLIPELEAVVGSGHVRLLGQRGATARVEAVGGAAPSTASSSSGGTAVAQPSANVDLDETADNDFDEL